MACEKQRFAYSKTKTQISFAVTAKLISAFVLATWIVQSFYFLNPKFQASSHLLWLYRPVCVGPGRKPRRPVFSQRVSFRVSTRQSILRLIRIQNRVQISNHCLECHRNGVYMDSLATVRFLKLPHGLS